MRKISSLILAVLMVVTVCVTAIPVSATQGECTIRVQSVAANPSETVEVEVFIENNPGIFFYVLGVEYDTTRLNLIGKAANTVDWGGSQTVGTKLVWDSSAKDIAFNGLMLTLTFEVLADAADGMASVTVIYEEGDICNYAEEDIIPVIVPGYVAVAVDVCSHETTEVLPGFAPTCTEDGLTDGIRCTDKCGEILQRQARIRATGHSFGDWIITQAPTCTENGVETRTCSACGEEENAVVYPTGHSFSAWTGTEVTCTVDGVKTRTCSNCGEVKTNVTYAQGHKVGDPVTVSEPTCTQNGSRRLPCMVCGETLLTEFIPATGHTFGEWTVTDATCTADGQKTRTCACGATETEVIPATGHTFGQWQIAIQATETSDGAKVRMCACGETETEIIPATNSNVETDTDTETEIDTDTESETEEGGMVTDTTAETEPATETSFVPKDESDNTAADGDADTTQAPAVNGGCRSAVGTVGVLLLAVAGAAAVTLKKRKD